MPKKLVVPILIIQTSMTGEDACRKQLSGDTGLLEGMDFLLFHDWRSASQFVQSNERQLLITGSFHGNENAAKDFVERMKEKSPTLLVATFSAISQTTKITPPYDIFIYKGDLGKSLIDRMKEFLQKE